MAGQQVRREETLDRNANDLTTKARVKNWQLGCNFAPASRTAASGEARDFHGHTDTKPKFAVSRQLRRNPGFSLTVIVTLAFAIRRQHSDLLGGKCADAEEPADRQPERMGTIYMRIQGQQVSDERHHVNGEQFELLRDDVPALITAISAERASGVNLQAGSRVQYVHAARVPAHYLDVLAIQPVFGRNFAETEDLPNGPKAAILSYGLVEKHFWFQSRHCRRILSSERGTLRSHRSAARRGSYSNERRPLHGVASQSTR